MGLVAIFGEPGSRHEEVARLAAQQLDFRLLSEEKLERLIVEEFGPQPVPEHAFSLVLTSILARLATEHHLMVLVDGAEMLARSFPQMLRVWVTAPQSRRVGALMIEHRVDRSTAHRLLQQQEAQRKAARRIRFKRGAVDLTLFDLICNQEMLEVDQIAAVVAAAAQSNAQREEGFLSAAAEAQLQFQARLELASVGIAPVGHASLKRSQFANPSEAVFAHLLDFYRIAWEYEPRSFALERDAEGRVTEAFTPDFYLPEFNLYLELTTMKQSLVTRKNRKIKRLKELYPGVNIQVFYQKDFEDLVQKHGLFERPVTA